MELSSFLHEAMCKVNISKLLKRELASIKEKLIVTVCGKVKEFGSE
jgi:hypothetical protein